MANVTVRLRREFHTGGYVKPPGSWLTVTEERAKKLVARGIADYGPSWYETKPNHVLMVSQQCDSRVTKQAMALRQRGWRVDLLGARIPQIPDAFDVIQVLPAPEWPAAIGSSGAGIVHVHNEPDHLMRVADEGAAGRPIVYDVHDMEQHRFGRKTIDQDYAFKRADAIVHTSREYQAFAHKQGYKRDIPEAVVHTATLRGWQPTLPPLEVRRGVVYEGNSMPHSLGNDRFRNHDKVVEAFNQAGVRFDMFTNVDAVVAYKGNARHMVPFMAMLERLPHYQWGFLGCDVATEKWDVVVPNKLFEYLLCGLPILACNAPAVERYMEGKAGIYANTMGELIGRIKDRKLDWEALVEEALASRVYMDDEVDGLIALYVAVTGGFPCELCEPKRLFKSDFALRGHVRQVHTGEWEAWKAAHEAH